MDSASTTQGNYPSLHRRRARRTLRFSALMRWATCRVRHCIIDEGSASKNALRCQQAAAGRGCSHCEMRGCSLPAAAKCPASEERQVLVWRTGASCSIHRGSMHASVSASFYVPLYALFAVAPRHCRTLALLGCLTREHRARLLRVVPAVRASASSMPDSAPHWEGRFFGPHGGARPPPRRRARRRRRRPPRSTRPRAAPTRPLPRAGSGWT